MQRQVDGLETDVSNIRTKVDTVVERLAQRPPIWASLLMTTMGAAIGAMVMWIAEQLVK